MSILAPPSLLLAVLFLSPPQDAPAPSSTDGPTDFEIAPFTFRSARGETVEAEKGTFRVIENRQDGGTRRIELAFVRFPTTGDAPGPPIVYLAGGPGGSATGAATGPRFRLFQALRTVADVIAFDQRGTGMSHRLPDSGLSESLPLDEPVTRASMHAAAVDFTRRCAAAWREQGVDLDAYDAVESADDLMDLRRVLGVERIALWGISYGTHLAFATLRRHGEHVSRAILAGVEGPDHTVKLPSADQRLLEEIARRVNDDPFAAEEFPDLLGSIETLLARLEAEPARVELLHPQLGPAEVIVCKLDAQRAIAASLRGPSRFARLPLAVKRALDGDLNDLAGQIPSMRRMRLDAMSAATDSASGISPDRLARFERERAGTLLEGAINFPFFAVREGLGVEDLGDAFRGPLESDVPTLFISGTLDGRTPPENAEEIRSGFRNGVHLVLDGAGHSDPLFLSSPAILETMLAFLRGEPVADRTIELPVVDFAIE